MQKGWRGVRRAWRVCAWIGCEAEIDAPYSGLCYSHFHERDRLESKRKLAQLELWPPKPEIGRPTLRVVKRPPKQHALALPEEKPKKRSWSYYLEPADHPIEWDDRAVDARLSRQKRDEEEQKEWQRKKN